MKKTFRIISLWIPVVVWMGIIFFLSSQPSVEVTTDRIWDFIWHKLAHIIEYAVLNMLIFRAVWWVGQTGKREKQRSLIIAFTISVLYAISDEIHQLYVPTREGRLRDVLIDIVGIVLGGFLSWSYIQTPLRKQEK